MTSQTASAQAVLDDAHHWADQYADLLELTATEFEVERHWPNIDDLQRTLAKRGIEIDVWSTVSQMPRFLGYRGSNNVLQLTTAGLAQSRVGRQTAEDVVRVVELAVSRYLGEGPATVTSDDVASLGMVGAHLEKVQLVALEEVSLWAGRSGPDEQSRWEAMVNEQVRHYRTVRTLDDFLRIRARDHVPSNWTGLVGAPTSWPTEPGAELADATDRSRRAVQRLAAIIDLMTTLPLMSSEDAIIHAVGDLAMQIFGEGAAIVLRREDPDEDNFRGGGLLSPQGKPDYQVGQIWHWPDPAATGQVVSMVNLALVKGRRQVGPVAGTDVAVGAMTWGAKVIGALAVGGHHLVGEEDLLTDVDRLATATAFALHTLRTEQRVDWLISHDQLTQCLNRHGLFRATARLADQAWLVHFFDVDDFGDINKRYGHGIGDSVLTELAAFLRSILGKEAHFCRWGGEEFVVVEPCGHYDLGTRGEGLVNRLANAQILQRVRPDLHERGLTISLGSVLLKKSEPVLQAIERAEAHAAAAKKAGKNQACM